MLAAALGSTCNLRGGCTEDVPQAKLADEESHSVFWSRKAEPLKSALPHHRHRQRRLVTTTNPYEIKCTSGEVVQLMAGPTTALTESFGAIDFEDFGISWLDEQTAASASLEPEKDSATPYVTVAEPEAEAVMPYETKPDPEVVIDPAITAAAQAAYERTIAYAHEKALAEYDAAIALVQQHLQLLSTSTAPAAASSYLAAVEAGQATTPVHAASLAAIHEAEAAASAAYYDAITKAELEAAAVWTATVAAAEAEAATKAAAATIETSYATTATTAATADIDATYASTTATASAAADNAAAATAADSSYATAADAATAAATAANTAATAAAIEQAATFFSPATAVVNRVPNSIGGIGFLPDGVLVDTLGRFFRVTEVSAAAAAACMLDIDFPTALAAC